MAKWQHARSWRTRSQTNRGWLFFRLWIQATHFVLVILLYFFVNCLICSSISKCNVVLDLWSSLHNNSSFVIVYFIVLIFYGLGYLSSSVCLIWQRVRLCDVSRSEECTKRLGCHHSSHLGRQNGTAVFLYFCLCSFFSLHVLSRWLEYADRSTS